MKRSYGLILVLVLIFANQILVSSCKKEASDSCESSKQPLVNISFNISTTMMFSDSIPFNRDVQLTIVKTYCNGTQSGLFQEIGTPGVNGYWHPGHLYTYKFENLDDRVTVAFYATGPDGQFERMEYQEFYYNGVFATPLVTKNYYITVPWSSTD